MSSSLLPVLVFHLSLPSVSSYSRSFCLFSSLPFYALFCLLFFVSLILLYSPSFSSQSHSPSCPLLIFPFLSFQFFPFLSFPSFTSHFLCFAFLFNLLSFPFLSIPHLSVLTFSILSSPLLSFPSSPSFLPYVLFFL